MITNTNDFNKQKVFASITEMEMVQAYISKSEMMNQMEISSYEYE